MPLGSAKTSPFLVTLTALLAVGWAILLTAADTQSALPPDAECRRSLVGTWQDEYQGRRTMTIRPDGSATMLVQLHGWKAALYASELQFEMLWSVQGGQLTKRTTGGRPSTKVKAILKALGNVTTERILALTAERLLLLDADGKRQYDWRRAPSPQQP